MIIMATGVDPNMVMNLKICVRNGVLILRKKLAMRESRVWRRFMIEIGRENGNAIPQGTSLLGRRHAKHVWRCVLNEVRMYFELNPDSD